MGSSARPHSSSLCNIIKMKSNLRGLEASTYFYAPHIIIRINEEMLSAIHCYTFQLKIMVTELTVYGLKPNRLKTIFHTDQWNRTALEM